MFYTKFYIKKSLRLRIHIYDLLYVQNLTGCMVENQDTYYLRLVRISCIQYLPTYCTTVVVVVTCSWSKIDIGCRVRSEIRSTLCKYICTYVNLQNVEAGRPYLYECTFQFNFTSHSQSHGVRWYIHM